MERLLTRHPRSATRLFTERELAHAGSRLRYTRLAGKFAAKEAVLKALGTGASGGIWFDQIEVLAEPSGAPFVTLHGKAKATAARLGAASVLVSISHERKLAMATAVLISPGSRSF